jgi:3',5'-nucleoside bisphosphate phosphatase
MSRIDLHIHSSCSDGKMNIEQVVNEASRRGLNLISITDHDSIDCQEKAQRLAENKGMHYISGLELNVTFTHPGYNQSESVPLDFLAYQYDAKYPPLIEKIILLSEFRRKRANIILEKINAEFRRENLTEFTLRDINEIEQTVNGVLGRPHLADYMVKKGIVCDRQSAFNKYLNKCNVPKMPLSLEEASELIKGAGGKLVLAHPNNLRGTSLVKLTPEITKQQEIIKESMVKYIDGLECWHPSHSKKTTKSYLSFANSLNLLVTGGSDCHQEPVVMGSIKVPIYVSRQFNVVLDC